MAGSVRDHEKRQRIREHLLKPEFQRMSDRQVAAVLAVSRGLVSQERRLLLRDNQQPEFVPNKYKAGEHYLPGQSARGGYVFDENQNMIRESEWERLHKPEQLPSLSNDTVGTVPDPKKKSMECSVQSKEMNFAELADFLGISRETARRLCVILRKIPYKRYGPKTCRVSLDDAEKYRSSVTFGAT